MSTSNRHWVPASRNGGWCALMGAERRCSMHLEETWVGPEAAVNAAKEGLGRPGMPVEVAAKTVKLELHCSDFTETGPDYCLWRAFDLDEVKIHEKKVEGY